jgi:hypothetical protein
MTATFCVLPIAVPTSVNGGCSGSADGDGGVSTTGLVGAGGRRDAEKSGRSRMAESELMGIPPSGLPPSGGSRRSGFLAGAGRCSKFGTV